MTGRRWLRAKTDTQWVLEITDQASPMVANPTVYFTAVASGATVRVDTTGSFSTNGPLASISTNYGDGTSIIGATSSHNYAQPGTYTVTVSVTDSIGRSSSLAQQVSVASATVDQAPVAALSATVSGLSVALDASGSTDADGTVVSYRFSFGDNTTPLTQSVATATHTYATAGTYSATVTVYDNNGVGASKSVTFTVAAVVTTPPVTGGGGGSSSTYVVPWTLGTWDEGLPASVVVVNYTDLYAMLSVSDRTATDRWKRALKQLPTYLASKGYGTSAAVQFPAGFDEVIPGFTDGTSNYWCGVQNTACIGYLGGLTNGKLQARLSMQAASMTDAQLQYCEALTTTGSSTGGSTTNQIYGVRFQQGATGYVMGMQFDGADMQTITDYRETGPAPWGGLTFYRPGANSIVQNSLFRAFGKIDSTSPPGEIGQLQWTRDINSLTRRVEIDGYLPDKSARRGGGFQMSGSNAVATDVWVHDTYTSGPTWSYASGTGVGNQSTDCVTTRFRSEENANHKGNLSGWRFAALNQENPQHTITHNQPYLALDDSTRTFWDAAHISFSYINLSDQVATMTVNDPTIGDSAKGGAYVGDGGCLSVLTRGYSSQKAYLPTPVITVGGKQLTAYPVTKATQVPSYVTPDKYFVWKQQN